MMNVAAYAIHFEHLENSFGEQPFFAHPQPQVAYNLKFVSLKLASAEMANIQTKYETNPAALVIL